ncbi:MAG: hypothetical protein L0Z50_19585 [Verrucomicrobiales bacterium]|nr:hypothetical protein [Verrucomicrobiales bacterium]
MKFGGLAESKKFLLCFPEGTKDKNGLQFWNASEACCDGFDTGVDDSGYLRGLIEVIGTRFPLDRKRIYAVGHSNGGWMAYRMACEHSDLIAAIASLMGMATGRPGGCVPSQPVNILHVHGSADSLVQYDGGLGLSFSWTTALSPHPGALESIALWARYNGCADATTDTDASLKLDLAVTSALDTVVTRYTKSPPGGAVELWTIRGGQHRPTVSPGFAASVVDWLLAHPKPTLTGGERDGSQDEPVFDGALIASARDPLVLLRRGALAFQGCHTMLCRQFFILPSPDLSCLRRFPHRGGLIFTTGHNPFAVR